MRFFVYQFCLWHSFKDFELQRQVLIDNEQNTLRLKEILVNCEQIIEVWQTNWDWILCLFVFFLFKNKQKNAEKQSNQETYFSCQTIDEKLQRILNEKFELIEELNKLKIDFDEQKARYQFLKERTPYETDFHQQNEDFNSEQQSNAHKFR